MVVHLFITVHSIKGMKKFEKFVKVEYEDYWNPKKNMMNAINVVMLNRCNNEKTIDEEDKHLCVICEIFKTNTPLNNS